jgi:hypothetical protein
MQIMFRFENLRGRDYSENLGVDRRIILEWILGNRVGSCGLDIWVRIWASGGLL